MKTAALLLAATIAVSLNASAQLMPPNASGVSMGHLHFHSDDPAAHVKFWTEVLGATPAKVGPLDVYKLPGVLIAITKATPSGGMQDSTVKAVGFRVKNLPSVLSKAAAAGSPEPRHASKARATLVGPDGIQIELTADPAADAPVVFDRIELTSATSAEMRKWYQDVFGATPTASPGAALLPGARLEFSNSSTSSATKTRVLDHIGFEVRDLKTFTANLAARGIKVDLSYLKLPDLGIAIGFVTDPWGTYIELTEGLNRI
ncbi:MAG: VOC family protein [Bryobacteraceae bacterium]